MEAERNWGVRASDLALKATPDLLEIVLEELVASMATAGSWIWTGVGGHGPEAGVRVWVTAQVQESRDLPFTGPPGPPFPY